MKRALREVQVQVSWDYWEAALHARRMDAGCDLRYSGAVESWGFVFLAASEAGRPGRAKTSSSNAAVGCGEERAAAGRLYRGAAAAGVVERGSSSSNSGGGGNCSCG